MEKLVYFRYVVVFSFSWILTLNVIVIRYICTCI